MSAIISIGRKELFFLFLTRIQSVTSSARLKRMRKCKRFDAAKVFVCGGRACFAVTDHRQLAPVGS